MVKPLRVAAVTYTLAFVMDPIERVNIMTDTTFALMLNAHSRGHRVIYVPPHGLALEGDQVIMHGLHVDVWPREGAHYHVREAVRLAAKDCHGIFVRTDPPFDAAYLLATWILSFAERQGVWVINSPSGIRSANEKLYALQFADLCPTSIVTCMRSAIRDFMHAFHGDVIAKPLDGHGGFGVVRLRQDDSNVNALIDLLTHEGKHAIVVQQYLPAGLQGDKRLLVVDGVLHGAVRRVPQQGDHRGNVHVGGHVEVCAIDDRDRAIVARMAETLRRDGLFFVGLDVIDGRLIEVNVTSPTLVQELHRLGGPDLAALIITAVEQRAAQAMARG